MTQNLPFEFLIAVALLVLGYVAGQFIERRHYVRIKKNEASLKEVLLFGARRPDASLDLVEATLVTGSVVISIDYFKRFVASMRGLIGGRFRGYETLVDRARREAIIRMKRDAESHGAHMIFNTKIETSSISKGGRSGVGSVEVLAYGTAVVLNDSVCGDSVAST